MSGKKSSSKKWINEDKKDIANKRARLLGRFYTEEVTISLLYTLRERVLTKKGSKSKIKVTNADIELTEYQVLPILTKGLKICLPLREIEDFYVDGDSVNGIVVIIHRLKNRKFEIIYHRVQPDDAPSLVHAYEIVAPHSRASSAFGTPGFGHKLDYDDLNVDHGNETNWTLRASENKFRGTILNNENEIFNSSGGSDNVDGFAVESELRGSEVHDTRISDAIEKQSSAVNVVSNGYDTSVFTVKSSKPTVTANMDDSDDLYATVDKSKKIPKSYDETPAVMSFNHDSDDSDFELPPPPIQSIHNGYEMQSSQTVVSEVRTVESSSHIVTSETVTPNEHIDGNFIVDYQHAPDETSMMVTSAKEEAADTDKMTEQFSRLNSAEMTTEKTVVYETHHSDTNGGTAILDAVVNVHEERFPQTTTQVYTTTETVVNNTDNRLLEAEVMVQGGVVSGISSSKVLDATVTVEQDKPYETIEFVQTSSPRTTQEYVYQNTTSGPQVLDAVVTVEQSAPPPQTVYQQAVYTHQQQPTLPVQYIRQTVPVQQPAQTVYRQVAYEQPKQMYERKIYQQPQPVQYVYEQQPRVIYEQPRQLHANVSTRQVQTNVVPQQRVIVQQVPAPRQVISGQQVVQMTRQTEPPSQGQLNAQVVQVTKTRKVLDSTPNGEAVIVSNKRSEGDGQEVAQTGMKEVIRTTERRTQPVEQKQTVKTHTKRTNNSQQQMQRNVQQQSARREVDIKRAVTERDRQEHSRSLKRGEVQQQGLVRHHRFYSVRTNPGEISLDESRSGSIAGDSVYSTVSRRSTKQYVHKPIDKVYASRRVKHQQRPVVYVEKQMQYKQRPVSADQYYGNSEIYYKDSRKGSRSPAPVHYITAPAVAP